MEQSHSEKTKRIAKNTLMLCGGRLVGMVRAMGVLRVELND